MNSEFNIIKKINNYGCDINSIVNDIVKDLEKNLVTKSDGILLNLVFSDNPTQADIDLFFSNWDIEAEGGHKSILLSYFMKMHPEAIITPYAEPRLKGLLQFYRFRNMKLIAHFKKICTELRHNNIKILVLKGGAMKHLRPEFSRVMGDIDILVPEKDFEKSIRIIEKMGYTYEKFPHSIDLHEGDSKEGILDIHHKIDMLSGCEDKINRDLFSRASRENVFGVDDILIPCPEDMFFISIINLSKNLILNHSSTGILYTLFDCKYLIDLKPDFDWNIVRQNSIKTNTESQLLIALRFINNIVPNLLPENIDYTDMFDKQFRDDVTLIYYNKHFLSNMREKSHTIKIQNIFKSWDNFKEYLIFRPKYFMFTRKMIRKNPKLAGKVLIRQKSLAYANR